MDELTVFWTYTAKRQRDFIFEYSKEKGNDKSFSRELNNSIREKIYLLKIQSKMDSSIDLNVTKVVSLAPYNLYYKIDGYRLIVIAFWDSGEDSDKILNFLQKR